jgi:REP element-mobilizing transposase RayT
MPRREIPFLPDQYYHFYNRGNNRQVVFMERENYVYFLKGIKRYLRGQVEVIAYCLMPTHYHLLVRVLANQTSEVAKQVSLAKQQTSEVAKQVPLANQTSEVFKTSEVSTPGVSKQVSLAMQKFLISYTKAINKRFERTGALFQGQFQAKPVTTYKHLLTLCAYIHANPVKDGLAAAPEMWDFSNYLEWLGLRNGTLVNREFIHENFGTGEEYKNFVAEYIQNRKVDEEFRKYVEGLER